MKTNEQFVSIQDLVSASYGMDTNWGTGYSESFPINRENFNMEQLDDLIKQFQEPFYPETYKNYDGWELMKHHLENWELTEGEQSQYFMHYRNEIKVQLIIEYYDTWKNL